MYVSQLVIRSSADGHLGPNYLLAVVSSVVTNMRIKSICLSTKCHF